MVVEVKPAHIRANMVKCTTAGMVKLTALGTVSTTMNALASTITLAKVPEEVVIQAEEPPLVEQQAAIAEMDISVDMMDSNGTVPTVELTHGTIRMVVIFTDTVLVDTQLHTELMAGQAKLEEIDVVADMVEVAEQLQPPLQLPPLVKNRDNGLDNKA